MAIITGSVRCISVAESAAFTTIREAGTGVDETLLLWYGAGSGGGFPPVLTAFARDILNNWVSLLREARVNNLEVTLVHPDGSAEVRSVRFGTF